MKCIFCAVTLIIDFVPLSIERKVIGLLSDPLQINVIAQLYPEQPLLI